MADQIWPLDQFANSSLNPFLKKKYLFFIYLAELGLSWGMWDL